MQVHEMEKPPRERLLLSVLHASGLYVGDNRMVLTERMLERDANWLLQVDTDIEFPPTIIETMLALAGDDKKILAASVPLGSAYPTCAFRWTGQPGIYESVPVKHMEPVEVDAIATAAILIHRDVFLGMADESGRAWFHSIHLAKSPPGTAPRDFAYIVNGEDIAFSMRAKAAGFKIWCVHVPGLKHYKTMPLTHDDERTRALAAQDSAMGVLVEE
jgi:hypothetical protein